MEFVYNTLINGAYLAIVGGIYLLHRKLSKLHNKLGYSYNIIGSYIAMSILIAGYVYGMRTAMYIGSDPQGLFATYNNIALPVSVLIPITCGFKRWLWAINSVICVIIYWVTLPLIIAIL